MKIKRMRLVLPARMSATVQVDARSIARAAARALLDSAATKEPVTVHVQGHGQPVSVVSRNVFLETGRRARSLKREG